MNSDADLVLPRRAMVHSGRVYLRPATDADLEQLVAVQAEGSVVALAEVFPQATHPFPHEEILDRWRAELADPDVVAYVSTDDLGRVTGFAARRHDELLHFGTAMRTWGTGLATDLHDALLATYPAHVDRLWLTVFEQNPRARRFWEKQGWRPTGRSSRTIYPPHPVLLEYDLRLRR